MQSASWLGDSVEEFKQLPPWGKIGVGVAVLGVAGLGFYEYRKGQQGGAATGGSASSLVPATSASGSTGGSQSPFPMVGNIPVLPSNINPITDSGGNTVAYQQQPTPAPTASKPQAGSTFAGPTGVNHYVATGNQSLSQIASALGLQSWNNIYAIPQNQQQFGKLNAKQAAAYVPTAGTAVVIPQGITKQVQQTGSGSGGMYSHMDDPFVYHKARTPHLPSTFPSRSS